MKIIDIISQNTESYYKHDKDLFLSKFKQLYQLPILHPTLNLITTKAKRGELSFRVNTVTNWDRLAGHCRTSTMFQKVKNTLVKKRSHIIEIRKIESDIIMHEIAHAMEKESGIDIDKEFRSTLGYDTKDTKSSQPFIQDAVQSVMKEELKSYKLSNVTEELFARYFELLAMSYEAGGFSRYKFKYNEIISYFKNTTDWVENTLNPLLLRHCDNDIVFMSNELYESLRQYSYSHASDIHSQQKKRKKYTESFGKWTGKTLSAEDKIKHYSDIAQKVRQELKNK